MATDRELSTAEAFDRIARMRYSCRDYRADEVGSDVLANILDVAQTTASWCNTQPWQVEITKGDATRDFIEALSKARANIAETPDFLWPNYEGVYLDRRRETGFKLYEAVGIAQEDRKGREAQSDRNFSLFGAPHVAIITTEASLGVYGAIDCGGWIANFMMAAKSRGVAAVAQAALARYPGFIRDYFKLPANRLVVCGISFGFPNEEAAVNGYRTRRISPSEAVRIHG